MNPLLAARLVKFAPWIAMAAGLAVGAAGLKSCASGLQERGRLEQRIEQLEGSVTAERDCEAGSQCAMRAVTEALATRDAVAQRLDELRRDNETRVADAVARYARAETRTRIDLERAQRELDEQRATDAVCAAWASERVGCIVRPIPPDAGGEPAAGGGLPGADARRPVPAVLPARAPGTSDER